VALIREYIEGGSRKKKPPYTLLTVRKRLEMKDLHSVNASFESTMRVRANLRTMEFVSSYLGGDGTISNILVNGEKPSDTRVTGVRTEIVKKFTAEKAEGEEFDIRRSYDLTDTFPKLTEGIGHIIEFDTQLVELEVRFHVQRPAPEARLLKRYAGTVQTVPDGCQRLDNGKRAISTIRKPLWARSLY